MYRPLRLTAAVSLCLLLCGSHPHAQTPPAHDPQAQAHRDAAMSLKAKYDYAGAIHEFQAACQQDKTAHPGDAAIDLNNIGFIYDNQSEYAKALDYFQQALPLYRQAGEKAGEATALNNIGAVCLSLGQYAKALEFYGQALPMRRQIGDKTGEAVTLSSIGVTYDHLSQYPKALDYYQQALTLQQQIGDKADQAVTLNNIAVADQALGQYAEALEFYGQALPLDRQVGDKAGEAVTLGGIGTVYDDLSQYPKALEFYGQGITILQQIGDKADEATALNNVGKVYKELSQYPKALEFYGQALTIHRQIGDRAGEAVTLNNIGEVYEYLSQYAKAQDFYGQALPIERQIGNRMDEAVTLSNIGDSYKEAGQYAEALEFYGQALPLYRQVGDKAGEAVTLGGIGTVYDDLGQYPKALDDFQQALQMVQQIGNKADEAAALNNLMFVWQKQRSPRLAIWYGKQAVNLYQSIRQDLQSLDQEAQKSYLAANAGTYRALADLLISEGRLPEAQQTLQLLKEQEFFDFLHGSAGAAPAPLDSAALTRREARNAQRYQAAAAPLATLGRKQQAWGQKKTLSPDERKRLAALDAQAKDAGSRLDRVLAQIAADFAGPPTADDAPPQTAGAQDVGRALPPGTVAVYTIVASDRLHLIVVTPAEGGQPSRTVARSVAVKADDLYQKVYAFRQALTHPSLDPRPLGAELHHMIFGPIQQDIDRAHATTILFSLDDALRYVPPAALYDDTAHKYVAEEYRTELITLVGSGNAPATSAAAPSLLGMGVTEARDGAPPLPGVKQELATLGGLFPGARLLDGQFTQRAMTTSLAPGRYPLVHIASHFALYPTDAASYLLLGDGTEMSVAAMKQNPRLFAGVALLTLSACDTAMEVRSSTGKEVEGFGALAQQLGAHSVVASLWPVSDAATPVWMGTFYGWQRQHSSDSLSEALRQAQMAMLGRSAPLAEPGRTQRAGRAVEDDAGDTAALPLFTPDPKAPFAHPYYWAPFILIGNWR